MGLFDRIRAATTTPPEEVDDLGAPDDPETPGSDAGDAVVTPGSRRPGEAELARVEAGLAALAAEGVDVDDLASLSASLDRALTAWEAEPGSNHGAVVERYGIGIGEHLARHTDLAWALVTDAFGTDLGVAAGDFVVVPSNLVAVRWMRRERGWVPGVVGHLVQLRSR